jgi:hypothetical protein
MAVVGGIAMLAGRARADERGPRPPVRLEIGACVDGERDAIQRAVRLEIGDDAPAADDARTVAVRVDCAADGFDAGVVIEVLQPDNPRHYRYALDWHAQPPDARPRLLGLAVAEAVDASRVELIAVPEPTPPRPVVDPALQHPPVTASAWTLSVLGGQRSFLAHGGFGLLGLGLMPSRRLSRYVRIAVDAMAETAAVVVPSGTIQVISLSSAPQVHYGLDVSDWLRASVGAGVRLGVVRMAAEAMPGALLVGKRLVRPWFGPIATVGVGFHPTPTISLEASLELGAVGAGVTARDLGQPAAAIDGAWTSFRLAATIAL